MLAVTRLPYEPEPIEDLIRRFDNCLTHVYDNVAGCERGGIVPAEVRANVFDFEDQWRFIVSRDVICEHGTVALHASASWLGEGPPLINDQFWNMLPVNVFVGFVSSRTAVLSGKAVELLTYDIRLVSDKVSGKKWVCHVFFRDIEP